MRGSGSWRPGRRGQTSREAGIRDFCSHGTTQNVTELPCRSVLFSRQPANLPTREPANLRPCKPANLPTCDPATPRTKKRAARIAKIRAALEEKPWRRATLPRPIAAVPSPLGPFTSVFGMGTGVASPPWPPGKRDGRRERPDNRTGPVAPKRRWGKNAQASRTISTGRVSASPRLRLRPIEVVVFHRP